MPFHLHNESSVLFFNKRIYTSVNFVTYSTYSYRKYFSSESANNNNDYAQYERLLLILIQLLVATNLIHPISVQRLYFI